MDAHLKQPQPNQHLRQQRRVRGWTLERAADELYQLCGLKKSKRGDINAKMIGSWERGEHLPSLFYQEKLSHLYGQSLQDLGFITLWESEEEGKDDPVPDSEQLPLLHSDPFQQLESFQLTPRQAIDLLNETPHATLEQRLGAWLALAASDLATLFEEHWTLEEVLTSFHIMLQGVQAMPNISRRTLGRKFLQLGAAAVISGVPIPTGKHISAEEQSQLHQALGATIASGWQLFHTAGNAQVLAVGHAQLSLVQQLHAQLHVRERSLFYSAIYDLIGKALFFQERYEEALDAHNSAYIAALQAGDPWRVTQSLICQADGHQALGNHAEAIQTIEEALRILGNPTSETQLRSKAHLLACWADNAMSMREVSMAQRQLEASALYAVQLGPNEEFDHANWLQLAGKNALLTGDFLTALRYYEEALANLPPHWMVRRVLVLIPMMVAYACKRDREASLDTAEGAVATLQALNAPGLNTQFVDSFRRGLLDLFPQDQHIHAFLTEVQQRYPQLQITVDA
jgi:tetratricopeptide (TPR) repeat protein